MTPERERHREIITVHVPISDCDPLVRHSAHCSREMMYMSVNPHSKTTTTQVHRIITKTLLCLKCCTSVII